MSGGLEKKLDYNRYQRRIRGDPTRHDREPRAAASFIVRYMERRGGGGGRDNNLLHSKTLCHSQREVDDCILDRIH
eukprot:337499-Hanusia_phi.AAC.5